ncbi:hypothetical protein YQE_04563, partial [Dendroctonus ponderosae]
MVNLQKCHISCQLDDRNHSSALLQLKFTFHNAFSSSIMSFHPTSAESIDDHQTIDNLKNVCEVLESEELHESPIDINISKVIPVDLAPPLSWVNYDSPPKKMKITNTGHTGKPTNFLFTIIQCRIHLVILSAKWGQERPYITSGVLSGKYVFSQLHLHWGANDMEGSEHTIDGRQFPGELHVVLFKSCYLTQEAALKERDGVVILVYILNLQDPPNPNLQPIVDALPAIAKAHTSAKVPPTELLYLMTQFEADYFIYRGSVCTSDCVHPIMWMITRVPIGISPDQMDSLRFLLDNEDELIRRNFRPVQPISKRHIFHILPSTSKYSTLLPAPVQDIGEKITQIYRIQLLYSKEVDERRKLMKAQKQLAVECLFKRAKLSNKDFLSSTESAVSSLSKYTDFIF